MEYLTDEKIMMEVKNGKTEYFNLILDRYYKAILNYAYRVTGNRVESEDIAQETFSNIYFAAKRYTPSSSFKAYMFTIAYRECLKALAKKKKILDLNTMQQPASQEDPHSTLDNKNLNMLIRNALMRLKPEYRSALILREYHDFSYAEIAQVLQCTIADIKNYIFRSKEQLKNILKPILSRGAL